MTAKAWIKVPRALWERTICRLSDYLKARSPRQRVLLAGVLMLILAGLTLRILLSDPLPPSVTDPTIGSIQLPKNLPYD